MYICITDTFSTVSFLSPKLLKEEEKREKTITCMVIQKLANCDQLKLQ